LNSTPLGEVISERQLYRHRMRAGLRIGDGKRVDLFRYMAWVREELQKRRAERDQQPADPYARSKEAARARNAAISEAGRDIGELPTVADPERKQRAESDFRWFCESYFPQTFYLPWSPDHLKVISKIEQAVKEGGLFSMAMSRGNGKALALDTPLPTPDGWTTMGDVQVGDTLFDEHGWPCRVLAATEVQLGRPCLQITFSDGESIVCDEDHLWSVEDRHKRVNPRVLPASTIKQNFILPNNRKWQEHRYRVPIADLLRTPEADLCIDPYVLGYWLGDGTASCNVITIHKDDVEEVADEIRGCGEPVLIRNRERNVMTCTIGKGHEADPEKTRRVQHAQKALDCGVSVRRAAEWSGLTVSSVAAMRGLGRWSSIRRGEPSSLQARLRYEGVLDNKHIPQKYLRAAPWQRLALLQGLMDSDGYVSEKGRCELALKDGPLARDVDDLLAGLGLKFCTSTKMVTLDGKQYGPFLRYEFRSWQNFPVFRLTRKLDRLRPQPNRGDTTRNRTIVDVQSVPSVAVRCIEVDSDSKLYLAGRSMVPTHNSSLVETSCMWAMLFGHREFVCLIGSDEAHAVDMLESIKTELDSNDLLLEDFPEVCFPIHRLEGIANRCSGQLYRGDRTHIGWTAKEVVLPVIAGSPASGAIIRVAGITGRIRGMKYKRPDGRSVRPSLVVIDDPQTDESARSLSQCEHRESILAGAILGLAGPGRKISGIMPCTVIRPGDMADSILDPSKHPEWNGERTKLVYSFPSNTRLWQQYAELRADGFRSGDHGKAATEFYRERRDEMDAGAVVAWPERFNPDELSAIQHAMNLKLRDEAAFQAEYQNEPLPDVKPEDDLLAAEQIAAKTNGHARRIVPVGATRLTAFIDVQQKLLYYVVCAWADDFTGYVIDYGTYPDQRTPYFTLRDAKLTLTDAAVGTGLEGSIYAGLEALCEDLLSREWRQDNGSALRIERLLIDANWGSSTDVVYQFCRQSSHAAILMPSHGRYVGASSLPFAEYRRKPGDRIGHNWRIPATTGRRTIRYALYDTNFWKSFLQARLAVSMGDRGCLSIFGRSGEPHRSFAEHITAEYRVRTSGRGREVDQWKLRPEASDNHWLDCLVGACVAASMQGVELLRGVEPKAQPRKRLRLSAFQRSVRRDR
jgi:hypothetical protein